MCVSGILMMSPPTADYTIVHKHNVSSSRFHFLCFCVFECVCVCVCVDTKSWSPHFMVNTWYLVRAAIISIFTLTMDHMTTYM